ncbi:MAG: hypothetical protein HUK03_05815 [Bacteroidaceae bacterium]|nr:hypothetical protein [Bacteroidaceae bacterium]
MSRYKYILDATTPQQSESDIMLKKIWQKVHEDIHDKYKSGTLTLRQMCHELGKTQFKFSHGRLETPDAFLHDLIKKTEEGKLTLTDSSWGAHETEEEHLEGTKPTINDMFPDSCGWNSYGGPKHDITLSSDEICVRANSAYQEFDGWSDTIDTSFHWQTRTFVYKYACDEVDLVFESLLSHYAGAVINKYTDAKYSAAFDKIVSNLAKSIIEASK